MQTVPIPTTEKERIQALLNFKILDTVPEEAFDDITAYAASYFNVPIALMGFIDVNRQWFKSCVGLAATHVGREESFCAYAIASPERLFIIPDTKADPRFADNPMVKGQPHVRFYAGATLLTDEGHAIGTLCLIDLQPRELTDEQKAKLITLADRVMARLKLRIANVALNQILEQTQR
jgi:GAF domain-containing protein